MRRRIRCRLSNQLPITRALMVGRVVVVKTSCSASKSPPQRNRCDIELSEEGVARLRERGYLPDYFDARHDAGTNRASGQVAFVHSRTSSLSPGRSPHADGCASVIFAALNGRSLCANAPESGAIWGGALRTPAFRVRRSTLATTGNPRRFNTYWSHWPSPSEK